ncbi:MAG: HEAT repeat domain-containing protein [Planctomycetota bacterium]|jgi:hypothetical protein
MRVLVLLALAVVAAAQGTRDAMREHGIGSDRASIATYLRSLNPTAAARAEAQRQVRRLYGEDPEARDDASRRLAAMHAAPIAALAAATRAADPEVARRARSLLTRATRGARSEVKYAVFAAVVRDRIEGLAAEVLGALPVVRHVYVRAAAHRALAATATGADAGLLRGLVAGDDVALREAATEALGRVLPETGLDEIVALTRHADERVRAAAAWALAQRHDRRCLDVFSQLLSCDDVAARARAWRALRAISGKRFNYSPHASLERREAPARAWHDWVTKFGADVSWATPLAPGPNLMGRLLVLISGESRVVDLDASGAVIWEQKGLGSVWSCSGTANGHRLIGMFDGRRIDEYDAEGTKVWSVDLPGKPCCVQRLDNGNTLVAVGDAHRVIEYRPDKTIAWDMKLDDRPFFARRLDDGGTLVTLHGSGRVVVIKPNRKIEELFKVPGAYTVQLLDNGNWLVAVAGRGRVIERTPAGEVVWKVEGLAWPATAVRLPTGDTIVGHSRGVERIRADGTRSWIVQGKGSVYMSPY